VAHGSRHYATGCSVSYSPTRAACQNLDASGHDGDTETASLKITVCRWTNDGRITTPEQLDPSAVQRLLGIHDAVLWRFSEALGETAA
jgi:hypothetical protein